MKFYQDITLLTDLETDLYFLWQKVYQQMHLALVEVKDETEQVSQGFSWPNYQYSSARKHLGNKLRVFASSEQELSDLSISKWLSRLSDYVHITQIRPTPEKVEGYACFGRVNVKSNKERIARRKSKREGISFDEALRQLAEVQEQHTDLPFVKLHSLSGDKPFPLFIDRKESSEAIEGSFSCYGLSKTTTVPLF